MNSWSNYSSAVVDYFASFYVLCVVWEERCFHYIFRPCINNYSKYEQRGFVYLKTILIRNAVHSENVIKLMQSG
jgi:hypothetical protein